MAAREVDHLLIGGGVAAASCAAELREQGADGSIAVVGREPDPPYDRPPLSKDYLRGESERADAHVHPEQWWKQNSVDLLTGTSVMKLDPGSRTATLSDKQEIHFGDALLATGANVRRLRAEGGDLDGIHYLRAFANADAIRADVERAEHVCVIGGSFIGVEVAASIVAGLGKPCTILMQESVALERQFGQQAGGWFEGVLRGKGVDVRDSDELERFEGSDGRVERVVSKGGLQLECDCVVIGAGVMPDVMLARAAGLSLGQSGGIACSPRLETSAPGIFAAGDVCEYESAIHGGPLRVEHWDVAFQHGRTAASNMLGRGVAHQEVPYFFSDIADWASLEYVGPGSGEPHVRGSFEAGEFTVFYVDGPRVTAALTVGRSDDLEHAKRWIKAGTGPAVGALTDLGTDLADL